VSIALGILGVVVSLALLWAGVKHFEAATPLKAILSALDVLALMLALVQLGWLGLGLFARSARATGRLSSSEPPADLFCEL
jgi:hypothetical protein